LPRVYVQRDTRSGKDSVGAPRGPSGSVYIRSVMQLSLTDLRDGVASSAGRTTPWGSQVGRVKSPVISSAGRCTYAKPPPMRSTHGWGLHHCTPPRAASTGRFWGYRRGCTDRSASPDYRIYAAPDSSRFGERVYFLCRTASCRFTLPRPKIPWREPRSVALGGGNSLDGFRTFRERGTGKRPPSCN